MPTTPASAHPWPRAQKAGACQPGRPRGTTGLRRVAVQFTHLVGGVNSEVEERFAACLDCNGGGGEAKWATDSFQRM